MVSASSSAADQTATPKRVEHLGGEAGLAHGAPRHPRAQGREQHRQIIRAAADRPRLLERRTSRRIAARAQPDDAAQPALFSGRGRRRREQAVGQFGPSVEQVRTDQQHDIGGEPRHVRRRHHHAGRAHDGEIAQDSLGMHVIDGRTQPLRQRNRGARPGDVGAQARHHRRATRFE
jgi:hypothetical protein